MPLPGARTAVRGVRLPVPRSARPSRPAPGTGVRRPGVAMLAGEVRRRVDAVWDRLWAAGVTSPLAATEHLCALLVVAHHPSDLQTTVPRPPFPEVFLTGDDLAADLGADGWEIVTNAAAPRKATDPEGNQVTIHDTVFRARRR